MKNKIIIIIVSIIGVLTLSTISIIILSNKHEKNIKEENTTSIETTTSTDETTTYTIEVTTSETTTTNNTTTRNQTKTTTKKITSNVVTEERTERKEGKYHVSQIITYVDTYRIHEDGRKELITTKQKSSKYDYSTYSATTNELKPEATTISNSNTAIYQEMLVYVNQLRSSEGASPLSLDSSLNIAATIRAIEIAWSGKFDHTRPNGTKCFTVYDELGISSSAKGENIAGYNTNVKYTFDQWNNSPGHHANMVSTDFTKIGVGKYTLNGKSYWVQLFGR